MPVECLLLPATIDAARIARYILRLGLRSRVQYVTLDGPFSPLAGQLASMTLDGVYSRKGRVHILRREGTTSAMGIRCCDVDRVPYTTLKAGRYLREYDGRTPIAMTGAMRGWQANADWHASFFSQVTFL